MRLTLEEQYIALVDKIAGYEGGVRKQDSYDRAAVLESLVEKMDEAEENPALTFGARSRIRQHVLDTIQELRSP